MLIVFNLYPKQLEPVVPQSDHNSRSILQNGPKIFRRVDPIIFRPGVVAETPMKPARYPHDLPSNPHL
jgi:hypothetical protein